MGTVDEFLSDLKLQMEAMVCATQEHAFIAYWVKQNIDNKISFPLVKIVWHLYGNCKPHSHSINGAMIWQG